MRYINYVESGYKICKRENFKFRLVFIGRLSKKECKFITWWFEKLEGETNLNLELIILGDGKSEFIRDLKNVKYLERLILIWLNLYY